MDEDDVFTQTGARKIFEEGRKAIEEIMTPAFEKSKETLNKIMKPVIDAITKEGKEFCEIITKPEKDFKTPFNLDEGTCIDEDYTTYNENDIMSIYDGLEN